MRHNWILDVLEDLCSYASVNGLVALTEQLADAKLIAAADIAAKMQEVNASANGQVESGSNTQGFGRYQRA